MHLKDGLSPEHDDVTLKSAFELYGEIISVGRKCIYVPEDLVNYAPYKLFYRMHTQASLDMLNIWNMSKHSRQF